jgi:hypothetical protein
MKLVVDKATPDSLAAFARACRIATCSENVYDNINERLAIVPCSMKPRMFLWKEVRS